MALIEGVEKLDGQEWYPESGELALRNMNGDPCISYTI